MHMHKTKYVRRSDLPVVCVPAIGDAECDIAAFAKVSRPAAFVVGFFVFFFQAQYLHQRRRRPSLPSSTSVFAACLLESHGHVGGTGASRSRFWRLVLSRVFRVSPRSFAFRSVWTSQTLRRVSLVMIPTFSDLCS